MNIRWLHVMIDLPADVDDETSAFWAGALGWPLGGPWRGHPEFSSFEPPAGDSYVARQAIGDGRPRVHLDIAVDDVDEVAAHMQAIGAEPGPIMADWRVMTSPGGMPYCLVAHRDDNQMPDPMMWPDDGNRSRLAQVCVDSSAERHATRSSSGRRRHTGAGHPRRSRPSSRASCIPSRGARCNCCSNGSTRTATRRRGRT
jgi:hypothetical protein